ncbi:MAG TPA: peptidoglycan DD-metalloendopeptidase family protein [Rhizomicrobium sp.]|jgi:murein DD-endopeptidase MepM/ murein hydrolase activator NlpD|nr:peptidoglycan DD-metalloendopeptidase family protein [Rhizomicrobium sp.]
MAGTLVERVWAWLHETFPERQIYIRSDGRVQFFTFGPTLQATLAGLSLIFLGWVAFATVNVIFKDRIISAKDHRYQQMQSAYENRVADLQLSYDELNGALVSAEDRFKATADELQVKQNTIMKFLDRRRQVDSTISTLANTGVRTGTNPGAGDGGDAAGPSDSVDNGASPAPAGAQPIDAAGSSELTVMPQPPAPQPRTAKPTKASFLDFGHTVDSIKGLIFGNHAATPTIPGQPSAAAFAQHPALRVLDEQTTRVARIGLIETALMTKTQNEVAEGVASIQNVIRHTGINPDDYTHRLQSAEGVGGPDIPLQNVQVEGIADQAFSGAYLRASAVLDQMNTLLAAMKHIPLTTPVWGSQFERTSGFGARIDPFTGHYSFHPGVDFAGPWGSIIAATAPGTVVYAGDRGGYGNMVEIDHGFGIHTRYGHMSSILVHVGSKVTKGSAIGRLGSTGRSTGPHVHYEVWYDNVVRNPSTFIEAGRHVFE